MDFPVTPLQNIFRASPRRDTSNEQSKKISAGRSPIFAPDARFLPYLQLHEYEALLFSDPAAFANGINRPNLVREFQAIRNDFDTPEDINNNPDTAPSKRILAVCPGYRKVIEGAQGAAAVGIRRMRKHCRHFHEWVQSLEALAMQGEPGE